MNTDRELGFWIEVWENFNGYGTVKFKSDDEHLFALSRLLGVYEYELIERRREVEEDLKNKHWVGENASSLMDSRVGVSEEYYKYRILREVVSKRKINPYKLSRALYQEARWTFSIPSFQRALDGVLELTKQEARAELIANFPMRN